MLFMSDLLSERLCVYLCAKGYRMCVVFFLFSILSATLIRLKYVSLLLTHTQIVNGNIRRIAPYLFKFLLYLVSRRNKYNTEHIQCVLFIGIFRQHIMGYILLCLRYLEFAILDFIPPGGMAIVFIYYDMKMGFTPDGLKKC
jgi:hypothetical protein